MAIGLLAPIIMSLYGMKVARDGQAAAGEQQAATDEGVNAANRLGQGSSILSSGLGLRNDELVNMPSQITTQRRSEQPGGMFTPQQRMLPESAPVGNRSAIGAQVAQSPNAQGWVQPGQMPGTGPQFLPASMQTSSLGPAATQPSPQPVLPPMRQGPTRAAAAALPPQRQMNTNPYNGAPQVRQTRAGAQMADPIQRQMAMNMAMANIPGKLNPQQTASLDSTAAMNTEAMEQMRPQAAPSMSAVFNERTGQLEYATPEQMAASPWLRPPAAKPNADPSTKAVYNQKTGGTQFATNEQITKSGGNLIPVPSGMRLNVGPDGSVSFVQGSGFEGGGPMTSSTSSVVEKDIIAADEMLTRFDAMEAKYKPEYLTYGGAFEDAVGDIRNKMNPEQRSAFSAERSAWVAENKQFFNGYRKAITGVAAGENEMKDIEASIPNDDDSPQDYEAKFANLKNMTRLLMARNQMALREGVVGDAFKPWAKRFPLDSVKTAIQARGDALLASGMDPTEVSAALKAEFGI